jgi:hypothetical protein
MEKLALMPRSPLARRLSGLVLLYAAASLLHFWHNAEYIAFYPNLPGWLTRGTVYGAWLAVTAVGVAAGGMWLLGWRVAAAVVMGVYGLLGLGGLAHYGLALCSEHTLTTNLTIWFEAVAGLAVAGAAARWIGGVAAQCVQ